MFQWFLWHKKILLEAMLQFLPNLLDFWTKQCFKSHHTSRGTSKWWTLFCFGVGAGGEGASLKPDSQGSSLPNRDCPALSQCWRECQNLGSSSSKGKRGKQGCLWGSSCWRPPWASGKEPQPREEAEPLHPAAITRKRAPCFRKVAFALSSCWTPQKVTKNDLNASFPWWEGWSREPLNEGSAFLFCFCPASVPFAVTVPAAECCHSGWNQPLLAFCPCRSLQHGQTPARSPGGLSQVWTLSLTRCRPRDQDFGLHTFLERCRNPNQPVPRRRFCTGLGRVCSTGD